jgi:hypothetical protein
MSQAKDIHGHYDGKYIVPDEPVSLPINKPLVFRVQPEPPTKLARTPVARMSAEQRRFEFRKLLKLMQNNPEISDEATRRVNLYADNRY